MPASTQLAFRSDLFRARIRPHSLPVEPVRRALAFEYRVDMATQQIALDYNHGEMLTTSSDGQSALLIAGDIYLPRSTHPGAALLDLYAQRGLDFVKNINGAFALVVIDRRADLIAFVTDRLNSSQLLTCRDTATLHLANAIGLMPVSGASLDRAAIAEYLSSSYLYNDRTPYTDIRALDHGSIYRLRDGQLAQQRYWRFEYVTPTTASPQQLQHDLGDLMVEGTRRRLRDDRALYVTLSGGYDSTIVAALLSKRLGVEDVTCFTYAYGASQPGSEESVAAQTAAFCGYTHRVIPSFDGDVAGTLVRNGLLNGGLSRPSDEVDAWFRFGAELENQPTPLLFTGDLMFLSTDWQLSTHQDLLAAAYLRDFSALAWLEPMIGAALYRDLMDAMLRDIDTALERAPRPVPNADPIDWRDMIRFEQIDLRMTGAWREHYAAPFFRPVHPLLDNDILDFILRLPAHHRRGKRLYLATVKAMFPALFAQPRAAAASYTDFWSGAIHQQKASLQALIRAQASPLDDVIEPTLLLKLLDADRTAVTRSKDRAKTVLKHLYRLLRRTSLHRTLLGRPSLYTPTVSVDNFLIRALTLRAALVENQGNS